MPQFMLLNFEPTDSKPDDDEIEARWRKFATECFEAGHMLCGDALHPADTATSVSTKGGEKVVEKGRSVTAPPVTTDDTTSVELAPLAVRGMAIFEGEYDEAVEWAGRMPVADGSTVEIRPIKPLAPRDPKVVAPLIEAQRELTLKFMEAYSDRIA